MNTDDGIHHLSLNDNVYEYPTFMIYKKKKKLLAEKY